MGPNRAHAYRMRRTRLKVQLSDKELDELRALAEHERTSLAATVRAAIRERIRNLLPVRDVA